MSDFTLGLDFGTSTTLVALPGLEPRVFPIGKEAGNTWLPSVISIDEASEWRVGEDADKGAISNQFRSPKSAITQNQDVVINANGVEISADEAIKKILTEVSNRCIENGLKNFSQVRLSCPAMWTGAQRKRLVKLVNEAGFVSDIDNVLDEPISASIAWWWSRFSKGLKIEQKKRAVIFDLGGGTLDVAVVDIYPRPGMPEMTILSARGIAVAGDELDRALAQHVTNRLLSECEFDVSAQAERSLVEVAIRLAARECKELLSSVDETTFFVDQRIAKVPTLKILRVELNDVYSEQMQLAINCVDAALREARMKSGDNLSGPEIAKISLIELGAEIDFIVLAGGMAQIPKVAEDLQALMPKAQIEFATSDPRTSTSAIVLGVANQNEFADLNIHRPNFDFVFSYRDRLGVEHRKVVYPAFTPLYSPEQVMMGDGLLGFPIDWKPEDFPLGGKVYLSIETIGGRKVSLRNHDSDEDLQLEFEADKLDGIRMKIYASGKIVINDRSGRIFVARVREWPHIRWTSTMDFSKFALKLELAPTTSETGKGHDWWRGK
jgi:molecular chaperone DnaK (HSP70)